MDCFLLPSLYEGLPVVGVEAENCGLPMFFSTEIPKESSACDDLGVFISLEKSPDEWADEILQVVKKNIPIRKGKTEEVKAAGFDSSVEANELLKYYEGLIASLSDDNHASISLILNFQRRPIFVAGIFRFSIQLRTVSRLTPRYSVISRIEYQRSIEDSIRFSSLPHNPK